MTVKELLQSIDDLESFADYYCGIYDPSKTVLTLTSEDVTKNINRKTRLLKFLKELIYEIEPKDIVDDEIYVIYNLPEFDSNIQLHTFLVKKSDIINLQLTDTYAYDFSAPEEILSYEVSQACLYYFKDDIFKFIAAILYEMTWFGYDVCTIHNGQQEKFTELTSSVSDAIENIDQIEYISAADVFKKFNYCDNRLDFEKDFDSIKSKLECDLSNNLLDALIKLDYNYYKNKN